MSYITDKLDSGGYTRLHGKIKRMHDTKIRRCTSDLEEIITLAPQILAAISGGNIHQRKNIEELHYLNNRMRDAYSEMIQCSDFLQSLDWMHDVIDDDSISDDRLVESFKPDE